MVNLNRSVATSGPDAPFKSVLYTIAVMTMTAALVGLGMAYALKGYFSQSNSDEASPPLTATHAVIIGPQRYAIPASLMTDPSQRRDGFAERIDMTLALPIGADGKLSEADITIMPRGRVRTSSALLDSVYLHQFGSGQVSGMPGLVGKPLDTDAGTQGEIVWYDPLGATPFTAKCMQPVQLDMGQRTCLRVFSLSDRNTAIISFEPSALADWRRFDATIEQAIAMLRI